MASLKQAVQWIADNDDAEIGDSETGYIVSICMVADLWGKEAFEVAIQVENRRRIDSHRHQLMIEAEEREENRMMAARRR